MLEHSQKEVLHDLVVVLSVAVWQETGRKHDDGVHVVAIVTLTKHTKSKFICSASLFSVSVLTPICPRILRPEGRGTSTSVGDDPHVGFDDLHVDAVLLLPDDHRPPQTDVLPLLLGAVRGDRIPGVAGATPAGPAGLWYQTEQHTSVIMDAVMRSGEAAGHGELAILQAAGFNSGFNSHLFSHFRFYVSVFQTVPNVKMCFWVVGFFLQLLHLKGAEQNWHPPSQSVSWSV